MSLFSNLVSGAVGAGLATALSGAIEKQGGIQAIVAKCEQNGLGETVKSWIGTGGNLPISAAQVDQLLDSGTVQALAAKFGISPDELKAQVAKYLPETIDKMTPDGVMPAPVAA